MRGGSRGRGGCARTKAQRNGRESARVASSAELGGRGGLCFGERVGGSLALWMKRPVPIAHG